MLLIILLVIILFLWLIFLSHVYISMQYIYDQTKQHVTVSVFILRIRLYKKYYDLSNINEKSNTSSETDLNFFSGRIKSYHQKLQKVDQLLNTVLKPICLRHFTWSTVGGTGDAALTGIMIGGIWTIKNTVSLYLINKLQLKCKPIIHVEPNFQHRFLYTNLDCMLSMRLGKAMYVFTKRKKYLQLMKEALQADKGGNE
ncbi:DUF2953 domain-containing protein [Oceanobacillus profundus]|uniref:DUF2953 domain-containing protein n=2 Tax=Bacillaceae TaxID=186817 RepID=A0A417YIL5_9BACI|nr:DUF2953 domain-containing protein [Oceanobacillus profundus]MBR3119575.1 DUF2953 domain-containing protein [Oceanobacillus sp.]PAE30886.1 hypothetical protein CHI07_01855 [Paenibacillus sp. 7884-2]MCM3398439.1 DUF2953 domain-containing protein [Oceanobacillus profundus]MDO6448400.1 DUF2953 domain-containing protein [Oceanobacillus profundus]RHW32915.1 DUF2953 domain-containing protein [Oceanobacillus profundus]